MSQYINLVSAINNCIKSGSFCTEIVVTKKTRAILDRLQEINLVQAVEECDLPYKKCISINPKYGKCYLYNISLNNNKQVYLDVDKLPRNKFSRVLLSTNKGILFCSEAIQANVGGKALIKILLRASNFNSQWIE